MAAHHGHDEHHQRPSVHTKQHGSQEQRWRRHIQHSRRVERMDGSDGPLSEQQSEGRQNPTRPIQMTRPGSNDAPSPALQAWLGGEGRHANTRTFSWSLRFTYTLRASQPCTL